MTREEEEITEHLTEGIYAAAEIVMQCEEACREHPDDMERQDALNAAVEAYDTQCDLFLDLVRSHRR